MKSIAALIALAVVSFIGGMVAGASPLVSPFSPLLACDVNGDGIVNTADLQLIRSRNGQAAAPGDPYDANGDGVINVADVRYCQLRCTNAGCSP